MGTINEGPFVRGPLLESDMGDGGIIYQNAAHEMRRRRAFGRDDVIYLIAEQAVARAQAERQRDYLEAALQDLQARIAETLAHLKQDRESQPAIADLGDQGWPARVP